MRSTFILSLLLALTQLASAATATNELKIEPTKIQLSGPIEPGPRDGDISLLVARVLERNHYSQKAFDKKTSSAFFDRYLEAWDPQRLYFLESDVKDFEVYRHQLDTLTNERADPTPAYKIFMRFRERFRQRVDYVNSILPKESLEFTGDEKVLINRKDASRPKDLAEAKQLWRERLRYELLQEKLNQVKPADEKKADAKKSDTKKAAAPKFTDKQAAEIRDIISRRYARLHRAIEEIDSDDVIQTYLTSLTHVYDPHSDYMGRATMENFAISMRLSLFGIGAVLTSEDGYCKIRELTPEGPAAKSKKLKPGDRIVAVAQGSGEPVDVVDMKLNKVVELIRGAKGSEVRLTVIPADAADSSVRKQIAIIRDEIKLEDQAAKAKLIELPDANGKSQRIGYIDLPSFYRDFEARREPRSTTTDVAKLIKKLKTEKMEGLILDLRRNGGGSLEEAITLTGLFIKDGPVVQVKDTDGGIQQDDDRDPSVLYDGPLVILTSRFSASASEILAGALQDYGRAVVVGDKSTHGKGTVQSLVQLKPYLRSVKGVEDVEPGALKITIRKFYRASGSSTQLKGVTPDIILPSVNNSADVGESSLENALPWDTIPTAAYTPVNRVEPYLPELRKRSEGRVAKSKDFDYVREDIQQYEKVQAEKWVSLNEAKRKQEIEEAKAKKDAREKEIRARHVPQPTTYEITLKLADQAGLPAPMTNAVASVKGAGKHPTVSPKAKAGDTDADEEEEDKLPARDVYLDEAQQILVDYIRLLSKGNVTTAQK
jgi:carboxyl-terminal processing protease